MFVPVTCFLSLCSTLWEGICCPQVLQVWFLSVLFLPFWSLFSILWMRKQEFKLIKEFPKVTEGPCGHRGWDGWMASLTQWTWVRANSGRWWRTGKPGVLQPMGSQRVRHSLATEQQQHAQIKTISKCTKQRPIKQQWEIDKPTIMARGFNTPSEVQQVFRKSVDRE